MSDKMSDKEYIYLLQEREFIRMNEPIYKIGKTTQDNHSRFFQYPKGSILLLQIICNDCSNNEKEIKKLFKNKYKQRKDYGIEYFEGDYNIMIKDIFNIISKEHSEHSEVKNNKNNKINIIPEDKKNDKKECKQTNKQICLTLQPHLQYKNSYRISSNQSNLYNLLHLQYNIKLEHLQTLVIKKTDNNTDMPNNTVNNTDNGDGFKFIEINNDIKKCLITYTKEKEFDKYTLLFAIIKIEDKDTIWIKGALQNNETKNIMLMTTTNNKTKLSRPIKTLDYKYFIGHYGMCAPLIFWDKLLERIDYKKEYEKLEI